jgi:thioredoxin-like negative regulator of GroEL
MTEEEVLELNDKEWEKQVEKSKIPVLVMFHSPTCAHCHVMEPYFRKYADEHTGKMKFIRLNIMTNQFITQRYGVMGTPTFKFFCQGRPIQELVGEVYPPLLKIHYRCFKRWKTMCTKFINY